MYFWIFSLHMDNPWELIHLETYTDPVDQLAYKFLKNTFTVLWKTWTLSWKDVHDEKYINR